jgi:hypothetical protein
MTCYKKVCRYHKISKAKRKRRRRKTMINKTLPRIPLNHEGEPRCSGRVVAFPQVLWKGSCLSQVFQKRSCLSPGAPEGALPFLFLLEKFEDTKEIIRSHIGKLISSFLSSCLLLNLQSLSISRCRSRYEFITSQS